MAKLIIDPGHGGNDPGGGSNGHWKEKDFVLDISLYQYRRFRELGVPVAITRTKDVTLSSTERTRIVRESGAEYCISNHLNAAGSSAVRGAETIHSIFTKGEFAKKLYQAIVAEGIPGRRVFSREGADGRDYYFMHRETGKVVTVIVEYGFATNPEDAKLLLNRWQDLAEAVVRAYCEMIGHPYKKAAIKSTKDLPSIQSAAEVIVDGKAKSDAYLIDNAVYVPIRFISEQLGVSVRWDNKTKTVYLET